MKRKQMIKILKTRLGKKEEIKSIDFIVEPVLVKDENGLHFYRLGETRIIIKAGKK